MRRQVEKPRPPMPVRLWNVREAAEFLGVPVSTLYYWSYRDEGPPLLRIGRCLRYEPEALVAWARRGRLEMGNVQKRPNGRWRARYRDPFGKEHARHFGRRLDAERWLASVESAKHRGEWIDPALSRITVGEWADKWLAAQVQLKPLTRERYGNILRVQIIPHWGRLRLAEVTHADVVAWAAGLQAEGYAAATIRQTHRVLSLMLTLAVRDRRLSYNPAEGVRLPRVNRKERCS